MKRLAVAILTVILVFSFTACKDDKQSINSECEKKLHMEYIPDIITVDNTVEPPQTHTIIVSGVEYTGTFVERTGNVYKYSCSNDFEFTLTCDNLDLRYYCHTDNIGDVEQSLTEQELISIAKNAVGEYTDTDMLKVTVDESKNSLYSIKFDRYIGEVHAFVFRVKIMSDGRIVSCLLPRDKALDLSESDIELIRFLSSAETEEKVYDWMTSKLSESSLTTYEITGKYLDFDDDENIVVDYSILKEKKLPAGELPDTYLHYSNSLTVRVSYK